MCGGANKTASVWPQSSAIHTRARVCIFPCHILCFYVCVFQSMKDISSSPTNNQPLPSLARLWIDLIPNNHSFTNFLSKSFFFFVLFSFLYFFFLVLLHCIHVEKQMKILTFIGVWHSLLLLTLSLLQLPDFFLGFFSVILFFFLFLPSYSTRHCFLLLSF